MPNFMRPLHLSLLFTLTPLVFAIGGCSAQPPKNTSATTLTKPKSIVYPSIDSGLSEKLYPNEQMVAEEIAEVMNCPIGTVRSRIFRAREAIDVVLKPLIEP